ncbi:MAG: extracellular solute-binding protein [Shimia sp.]|uniref:extracellular solute-binding protein n=1 Tax=Shimia sp. TaxID=1954381 RepID=UPI003B8CB0DF
MGLTRSARVAAAALGLAASPLKAGEDAIWFYAWNNTIPQAVVQSFGERHGINAVVDTFMVADEVEARLAAGGTGYDLAVVPVEIMPRLVSIDALQPFDAQERARLHGSHPELMEKLSEAVPMAEQYAVPFLWGTTGLMVDIDDVLERVPESALHTWDLVFDPKYASQLADCGITIADAVQEVVAIALNYLGRNPNSMAEDDLDAAFDLLAGIMPYVNSVDGSQQEQILQNEACVALTWSSDALAPQSQLGRDEVRYFVPEEGTVLWADVLVLPNDTGHLEHSHKLLRYMNEPEVLAKVSQFSLALTDIPVSHAALQDIDREILEQVAPKDRRDKLFMLTPRTGSEKRILDRRWRRMQLGL